MGEANLITTYQYRNNKNPGGDVAIAFWDDTPVRAGRSAKFTGNANNLSSPVNILLQHMDITESEGCQIHSTCPPSEMCLGLARLYGIASIVYRDPDSRRLTTVPTRRNGSGSTRTGRQMDEPTSDTLPERFPGTLPSASGLKAHQIFAVPEAVEFLPMKMLLKDQAVLDRFYTHVVLEIARRAFGHGGMLGRNPRDYDHYGKNIASALVDREGTLVSWGVNTNLSEKWRHAEVNTIYNLMLELGETFPEGATLYTTLEPCEMCAGLIAHVARGKRLRVVRAMDDPGISNSALQIRGRSDVTSSASPASLRLDALTNRSVRPASLAAKLKFEFETWRDGEGEGLPMTQFFNTDTFLNVTKQARQHWFEVAWEYLQSEFYTKHKLLCDKHVGRKYRTTTRKVGWTEETKTESRVFPDHAKSLASLSKNREFISDMGQLSNNLCGMQKVYAQFLEGIPGQLGGT